jgi:polysaccharide deacetylase family protein (PEP-CTERM system associated)
MAIQNVMSVDVEDYFQAEVFAGTVRASDWDAYPSRVQCNTKRLLDLFAFFHIRATFFIVGWVADRFPALLRDIASSGHELGCHSYWHRPVYRLNPRQFREDTRNAKTAIEQAAGQPVFGYRAPTFSIIASTWWALEILAEEGFQYDSSIFPIRHDRYGIPSAPRFPFLVPTSSGPLLEYPVTTFRLWGRHNLPLGGGGYLRLLPEWYTRLGITRAHGEGLPLISYVHPWEIDPEQPRLATSWSARLRHYSNLSKTYHRLEGLLGKFEFTAFRNSGLEGLAREENDHGWNTDNQRRVL